MMRITECEDGILLEDLPPFDIHNTLGCGQAFRWSVCEGVWQGIVSDRFLTIQQVREGVVFASCTAEDFNNIWLDYFDLERDYPAILKKLAQHPALYENIQAMPGLKILHQPAFECLISFILSSTKSIPQIRVLVERLCCRYGRNLGEGRYAFPLPEVLAEAPVQELRSLGMGYRDQYVHAAARAVAEGLELEKLAQLPLDAARDQLMQLPGVGPKIADCVLLFSCRQMNAFPVDTWISKALKQLYQEDLTAAEVRRRVDRQFGGYAGLAQQYLFHGMRLEKQKTDVFGRLG